MVATNEENETRTSRREQIRDFIQTQRFVKNTANLDSNLALKINATRQQESTAGGVLDRES